MWNASRCAVREPIPGRRVSCATRFSTEGLNTSAIVPVHPGRARAPTGHAEPRQVRCQTPPTNGNGKCIRSATSFGARGRFDPPLPPVRLRNVLVTPLCRPGECPNSARFSNRPRRDPSGGRHRHGTATRAGASRFARLPTRLGRLRPGARPSAATTRTSSVPSSRSHCPTTLPGPRSSSPPGDSTTSTPCSTSSRPLSRVVLVDDDMPRRERQLGADVEQLRDEVLVDR